MAHQYGQPIHVTCAAPGAGAREVGEPQRFTWRGREHVVVEILAAWHLRDRWWDLPRGGDTPASPGGASDRHYYRVQCADGLLCEVYYDTAHRAWVLDRVHD
jgi:hypothetical protein